MGAIKQLTGQRFERLVVISFSHLNKHRKACWLCRCDCGLELTVLAASLCNGNTGSCGCLKREIITQSNQTRINSGPGSRRNLTGLHFGQWIAIKPAYIDDHNNDLWLCQCCCGTSAIVQAGGLINGRSQSCGCLKARIITKHGHATNNTRTPEYICWVAMIQRCENPRHKSFHNYGGRGIKVCERWHDFATFLADIIAAIGPCQKGKMLDRINNDGNYEPGNVRWATPTESANNRRPSNQWTQHA